MPNRTYEFVLLDVFTRTLALEFAGRGIRVNGIGPGATVTPINRAWIEDPVKREQVESHIPMARAGTADEMGAVACFLASDDAAYMNGVVLDETREGLLKIVKELKTGRGIEGLILGGTELSLILSDGDDEDIPFLDTTRIHARSAVRELLRRE